MPSLPGCQALRDLRLATLFWVTLIRAPRIGAGHSVVASRDLPRVLCSAPRFPSQVGSPQKKAGPCTSFQDSCFPYLRAGSVQINPQERWEESVR